MVVRIRRGIFLLRLLSLFSGSKSLARRAFRRTGEQDRMIPGVRLFLKMAKTWVCTDDGLSIALEMARKFANPFHFNG